ncbi:hypothetical protein V8C43DRAFT_328470 [Trichoderma afarasin]
MRARVGDAQMNNARPMEYMHPDHPPESSKRKRKHNPIKKQHSRGTSRPRVAALTLGACWKPGIQISHLRQRFSALCGGCQPLAGLAHDRLSSPIVPLVPLHGRPRLGRASKAPPESIHIIRQDPAKETSDHAEVGLGLGWHRVQSPRPTREGQKWSEGHSDVPLPNRIDHTTHSLPATRFFFYF